MAGAPTLTAKVSFPALASGLAVVQSVIAGGALTVQVAFTGATATGVQIYAADPNGALVTPLADPVLVADGSNTWQADIVLTAVAGEWTFQGYAAGPVPAIDETQLFVRLPVVPRPVNPVVPANAAALNGAPVTLNGATVVLTPVEAGEVALEGAPVALAGASITLA